MAIECMHEVRGFIKLLVESEIVPEKKVEVKPTKKKTRKSKKSVVKEPPSSYGQGNLFEEPNLFNQESSNKVIKQGSLILLKPDDKDAHWFSIGANAKNAQKLSVDSAIVSKLLGKTIGDRIDFGNGFEVLNIKE